MFSFTQWKRARRTANAAIKIAQESVIQAETAWNTVREPANQAAGVFYSHLKPAIYRLEKQGMTKEEATKSAWAEVHAIEAPLKAKSEAAYEPAIERLQQSAMLVSKAIEAASRSSKKERLAAKQLWERILTIAKEASLMITIMPDGISIQRFDDWRKQFGSNLYEQHG